MELFKPSDLIVLEGEPRLQDLMLAERLGMTDTHSVRKMIRTNRPELEGYGSVSERKSETGPKGGRPSTAYYLNEGQALTVCALSRTPTAAMVRRGLITVFIEFRNRKVEVIRGPATVIQLRPPVTIVPEPVDRRESWLSFFKAYRDHPEALADWAESQALAMEQLLSAFTGQR